MSYATLLIDVCNVSRYTEGLPDAYGNPALTWADHLTDEPCRLTTPTGREVMVGAQLVVADYLVFLGDVDVTEQDRITIDLVSYEVLLVADRQDGFRPHHKEAFVRTVR